MNNLFYSFYFVVFHCPAMFFVHIDWQFGNNILLLDYILKDKIRFFSPTTSRYQKINSQPRLSCLCIFIFVLHCFFKVNNFLYFTCLFSLPLLKPLRSSFSLPLLLLQRQEEERKSCISLSNKVSEAAGRKDTTETIFNL